MKGISVFTKSLLDALENTTYTNDGLLTIDQVFGECKARVARFTAGTGNKMTPRKWEISVQGRNYNGTFIFITGLGWVLWQRFRGVPQHIQLSGVLAASGAGIAFSLVGLGLFATFEAGAPISVASPFIRLGGLLLASVAGLVLLHEALSWRYVLGMLLACSGVYLIVTR